MLRIMEWSTLRDIRISSATACVRMLSFLKTPLIQSSQVLSFVVCCSAGLEHNFRKYTHAQIDRLEAPYDMESVMHLPRDAFSKNNLHTIEARAGSYIRLGSDNLSEIDKAQLNLLYSCTGYPSKYSSCKFQTESFYAMKITTKSAPMIKFSRIYGRY